MPARSKIKATPRWSSSLWYSPPRRARRWESGDQTTRSAQSWAESSRVGDLFARLEVEETGAVVAGDARRVPSGLGARRTSQRPSEPTENPLSPAGLDVPERGLTVGFDGDDRAPVWEERARTGLDRDARHVGQLCAGAFAHVPDLHRGDRPVAGHDPLTVGRERDTGDAVVRVPGRYRDDAAKAAGMQLVHPREPVVAGRHQPPGVRAPIEGPDRRRVIGQLEAHLARAGVPAPERHHRRERSPASGRPG